MFTDFPHLTATVLLSMTTVATNGGAHHFIYCISEALAFGAI